MSGIKGGPYSQKVKCQDPCKNPCQDPCQRVPICVDPCQDPCKAGLQSYSSHSGQRSNQYFLQKKDPCNPCCPDPCQNQGSYCYQK